MNIGAKSAGSRLSFHPLNHIRITPGASDNATSIENDLSNAASETNMIEEIKAAQDEVSLEASLASIGKPQTLVHSKSTGNLWVGGMRRIKEALRFVDKYFYLLISKSLYFKLLTII